MIPLRAPNEATFGYLSAWNSPQVGCLGGYLIVTSLGRPIEFHCTAPMRPSRAQEILFGPTLWQYVLGEQIGGRLLAEAKARPNLVIVDHPATLCLRSASRLPMVLLTASPQRLATDPTAENAAAREFTTRDAGPPQLPSSNSFVVGECLFAPALDAESDSEPAKQLLELLACHVDLVEPFDRIREAIREALRLGDRFGEARDHAA
jgi:hypothetical protein